MKAYFLFKNKKKNSELRDHANSKISNMIVLSVKEEPYILSFKSNQNQSQASIKFSIWCLELIHVILDSKALGFHSSLTILICRKQNLAGSCQFQSTHIAVLTDMWHSLCLNYAEFSSTNEPLLLVSSPGLSQ